ncbi:hypothetical protein BDR03DRAFT_938033 [Suillus americanus]|nr:hypothetical protein BDR03DRAFT_938033 [Suillus americanus]
MFVRRSSLMFYGYAISHEWLVRFAERHCPEALPDRSGRGYEDSAISRAYEHLVDLTGINNLDPVTCFNLKGGSVPAEWIAVYDGDYDNVLSDEDFLAIRIDTVYVLGVCLD